MFLMTHVRKFIEDNRAKIPNADQALELLEKSIERDNLVTAGMVDEVLGKEHCILLGQLYITPEYQTLP